MPLPYPVLQMTPHTCWHSETVETRKLMQIFREAARQQKVFRSHCYFSIEYTARLRVNVLRPSVVTKLPSRHTHWHCGAHTASFGGTARLYY